MGSITNSMNGLSYLLQPGGIFSNLPAQLSTAELQSASPQDLVDLSVAALQTQQATDLFAYSQVSQNPTYGLPIASSQATDVLTGLSLADLPNATPQEQNAINNQAVLLQQVQGLFGEPTSPLGPNTIG